jgi:UDP-N-acetylglucosamine 2-epimerase
VLIVADEIGAELATALGQLAGGELEVEAIPQDPTDEERSARPIGARMVAFERLARDLRPDAAVIGADQTDALAAALALSKLELPLARVEAGGDEDGAVLTERLCELLLCRDQAALTRLRRAGLGGQAHLVGAPTSDRAVRTLIDWIFSRPARS